MTTTRRFAAILGLALVAGMCAFPPWVSAPGKHPSATNPAGYRPLWDPPRVSPPGEVFWSSKRQRFERDGKPTALQGTFSSYLNPITRDDVGPRLVRIDYARLFVQSAALAALIGIVMLLPIR